MLAIAQDNELDRGATSVAPGTERTCALTRELKPVVEMIRFVVCPAGDTVPDIKRKLHGRSIWITLPAASSGTSAWPQIWRRKPSGLSNVPRSMP